MRVRLNDSFVERWANTGGRPLGLAFSPHRNYNQLIVADAVKGLLKISKEDDQDEAIIELLTDEAEGLKFGVTDGVDVADDGIIYFTDASYKYLMHEYVYDNLEGRPHGRLLSYDLVSKETKVLLQDLYFANGVALSPDQTSVNFCETSMRRCSRYHIDHNDGGNASVTTFVVDFPGFPDNVHYDGEGHYWIAITSALPPFFYKAFQSRLFRKV
ncbi:hypothetical protein Droror1_Dr00019972 [Drosera rotundifolia]